MEVVAMRVVLAIMTAGITLGGGPRSSRDDDRDLEGSIIVENANRIDVPAVVNSHGDYFATVVTARAKDVRKIDRKLFVARPIVYNLPV